MVLVLHGFFEEGLIVVLLDCLQNNNQFALEFALPVDEVSHQVVDRLDGVFVPELSEEGLGLDGDSPVEVHMADLVAVLGPLLEHLGQGLGVAAVGEDEEVEQRLEYVLGDLVAHVHALVYQIGQVLFRALGLGQAQG